MNHSGSARIYGKRAGGTENRENGSCVLLDCLDENYISFEQFDSMAGCCGALSTGNRRASEQIVGFA